MKHKIKTFIKSIWLYKILQIAKKKKNIKDWVKKGRLFPAPPLIKQRIVNYYAKKYKIPILIETGTYLGSMINATKNQFERIISIELDQSLFHSAKKKFSKYDNITIIQGDSSEILPEVLHNINEPCLFWLDAHYSGGITAKGDVETPIIKELLSILNHHITEHIILIDDAHLFIGQNDYPTLDEVNAIISEKHLDLEVKNDIIFINRKKK